MQMQIERIRADICTRLRLRQPEIEQAALVRVRSVSDPEEIASHEYAEGLRVAVLAALEYGIAALGRSEDRPLPIPTALLSQARLASRNRVSLDVVLRRYFAGYTLLGDFLIEEAERAGVVSDARALKRLLRAHAAVLDRLLAAVSEEYAREKIRPSSREERRAERVERLLAGEPLDTSELAYDFEAWHLAIVACGEEAEEAIVRLAGSVDARPLTVRRGDGLIWTWLGSRRALDSAATLALARNARSHGYFLALGEPDEGIGGWRLTHRQAEAGVAVAQRGGEPVVRYAEVALVAAALQDELLSTSLHNLYLKPLEGERDGGAVLRETLRAYFAAARNVTSTAAALGASRNTIAARLTAIEEKLDHSLTHQTADIEVAFRLNAMGLGNTAKHEPRNEQTALDGTAGSRQTPHRYAGASPL